MLSKPFEFGPENMLVGAEFQVPEARRKRIGTVIWGMGMQEALLARKFSRLGVPSLLVRVKGAVVGDHISYAPVLARRGVELCSAAVDALQARQSVQQVVAIGTCARAALVLNAADQDARIAGVVATNMLIHGYGASMLARARRILSEPARLFRWLGRRVASSETVPASAALPPDFDFGVIALDRTLPALLCRLTDRDVAVHIVCTSGDDSLALLQTRFRTTMHRLRATGRVTLQVIRSNLHRINDDEQVAATLNEGVFAWLRDGDLLERTHDQATVPVPAVAVPTFAS